MTPQDNPQDDTGASPLATGLAGAEAPEPPSRLGPSDGIPSALIERVARAICAKLWGGASFPDGHEEAEPYFWAARGALEASHHAELVGALDKACGYFRFLAQVQTHIGRPESRGNAAILDRRAEEIADLLASVGLRRNDEHAAGVAGDAQSEPSS